jgi:hypothetical protein
MTIGTRPSTTPPRLHPGNLALRFMLELWALFGMGYGSHVLTSGWLQPLATLAVPLSAAALWGTFTVRGDPSRGKAGPVCVSGKARLALEAGFFCLGCGLLLMSARVEAAAALAALVALHYALAHARTRWLFEQRAREA